MSLPDALRPSHAYVPGQNVRHPEDRFDHIKSSVMPDVAVQDTQAWQVGLAYLHAGYFWECHEVLEAVWLSLPVELLRTIVDLVAPRDLMSALWACNVRDIALAGYAPVLQVILVDGR